MFLTQWLEKLRSIPMSARNPKISNQELDRLYEHIIYAQIATRRF